jgi:arylsulfatase
MTEDQGMRDLSCMGNPTVKTANIDIFYNKSKQFYDCHVSPTCVPTRASLMSGIHEFKVVVTHTIYDRERMTLDEYTMPQPLKSTGQETGLFGKWYLSDANEYLPQNKELDEVLMHGVGGIGQVVYGDFPTDKDNTYFDNVLLHNRTIDKTKGFCAGVLYDAALGWTKKQFEAKKSLFTYISLNAPHGPIIASIKYKIRFLELSYDEKTASR